MNEFSDDILVAASRRGDKSAYAVLVKRHYRHVFALCLGVLGNAHDAEDVAQDAMLRGFVGIKELRNSERFDHWILRIAKNLCVDLIRRQKRVRLFSGKAVAQPEQIAGENSRLEGAIRRLPREFRLPLMMYYFDGKSAKTIAEKLNISYSGVCHRIRTARKQLHKLLTERVQNE